MWSLIETSKEGAYESAEKLIMCTPKTHVLEPDEMKLPPLKLGPKIQLKLRTFGQKEHSMIESPSKPSKVVRETLSMPFPQELGVVSPLISCSDDETLSESSSIVSPISDISSVPSSSPDVSKKHMNRNFLYSSEGAENLDTELSLSLLVNRTNMSQVTSNLAMGADDNTTEHTGTKNGPKLGECLFSSRYVTAGSRKRSFSGVNGVDKWGKLCHPRHYKLKPKKSSLKLSSDRLNFLMDSSNGNVRDATIFATEINTCNSYDVPFPSTIMERVTIPVNTHVKEHYKNERCKQLSGYYDEDDSNSDHEVQDSPDEKHGKGNDSAIIRAYEFERLVTFNEDGPTKSSLHHDSKPIMDRNLMSAEGSITACREIKKVRWAPNLEW
ncbi:Sfg1p Ecym_1493 [Eremothecium cymbalariae DBVPG|uniref:Uncharacterized protein n=1 Tax=Eremothecium cymbalariae (strain CBS 270.75 / DBVPG 7215 / KCTC 17166 / NRRL Y-17582) TaxID=931890 RepID=G8JMK0_ERECY|nr:hypothetical protein Ecym_1493 [Eremothecium cymbalariae DBVPG\